MADTYSDLYVDLYGGDLDAVSLSEMVDRVRRNLGGGLPDEINLLDGDYTAGSGSIRLVNPTRALQVGSLVCVGLNTFYVTAVGSDGRSATVIPSYDGGPDAAAPSGSRVYMKPRATTFDIFRRLSDEISALASPMFGLYGTYTWVTNVDPTWETYTFPSEARDAVGVLEVSYLEPGSPDRWIRVRRWDEDDNDGQRVLRINQPLPGGTQIQVTVKVPFSRPVSLDSTSASCGLSSYMTDIPVLGATASLMASGESRRLQPMSQGDPRRADEVTPGYSVSTARTWRQMRDDRINEEHVRLLSRFPIMQRVT